MEVITHNHYYAALFFARIFLGCLFFFQGYDAVFRIKVKNIARTFEHDFSQRGIPKFLTLGASWFTSYSELICGAFLITGLFKYAALYFLGINLLVAAIGFGINTPVWDTRHAFPRLILVLALLILPPSWDSFTLDHLFFNS